MENDIISKTVRQLVKRISTLKVDDAILYAVRTDKAYTQYRVGNPSALEGKISGLILEYSASAISEVEIFERMFPLVFKEIKRVLTEEDNIGLALGIRTKIGSSEYNISGVLSKEGILNSSIPSKIINDTFNDHNIIYGGFSYSDELDA